MAILVWTILLLPLLILSVLLTVRSEQSRRITLWLYAFNFCVSGLLYLTLNYALRQAAHIEKRAGELTGAPGQFTIQLFDGAGAATLSGFFRDPQLASALYLLLVMAGYAANRHVKRRVDVL